MRVGRKDHPCDILVISQDSILCYNKQLGCTNRTPTSLVDYRCYVSTEFKKKFKKRRN